jgi:hypothetical protein
MTNLTFVNGERDTAMDAADRSDPVEIVVR